MVSKIRKMFVYFGPAYLISIGYIDPGNWATDIAAGSHFGYKLLWVLLAANIVALLVQSLSVRLGVITGKDLAAMSQTLYPKQTNFGLYIFAMIAIIATDAAEIIGVAIGIAIIFKIPIWAGAIIGSAVTLLILGFLYDKMRKLEMFLISLVAIVAISFMVQLFILQPNTLQVFTGFSPTVPSGTEFFIALGILGAVVMPHNIYLHSHLVTLKPCNRNSKTEVKRALFANFIDTFIALNIAFFINSSILIVAASAFYGVAQITGLVDAHNLLHNFGSIAPFMFGIALIAAGQSSTITGTMSATIITQGYLSSVKSIWKQRTLTRLIALAPVLWISLQPDMIENLMVASQVVLSLQLGFVVAPLIQMLSNKKIMGDYALGAFMQTLSWLVVIALITLNTKLVIDTILDLTPMVQALLVTIVGFFWLFFLHVFSLPYYSNKWKAR